MYLNCAHEVQAADTLVVRCLHLVSAVLACPAYRPGRKPRSDADADARAGVRPLATAEQVPREGEGGGGWLWCVCVWATPSRWPGGLRVQARCVGPSRMCKPGAGCVPGRHIGGGGACLAPSSCKNYKSRA